MLHNYIPVCFWIITKSSAEIVENKRSIWLIVRYKTSYTPTYTTTYKNNAIKLTGRDTITNPFTVPLNIAKRLFICPTLAAAL
ncbi:MAG: hypothetical protein COB61_004545 [Thiotrichales bacterium]|nr:hypothetical protein [Thiotrichales bacterium]